MGKLRILLGADSGRPDTGPIVRAFRALPEVETLTFAEQEADVVYDFGADSFRDIMERLPKGWEPGVVAIWSPDWYPIPVGFEESPYPTLGFVQDWNLHFRKMRLMMHAFDYIFTDQRGAELFRRAGHRRAEPILMYSYDPQTYRRLPGVEKVWDIGIVANLNHAVQRERSRWLARIARLSDSHRVRIVEGLYGEDEVRALNETKITFNRSVAGAMNLRAYQAPACGSMLFLEEENLEVQDVYEDRVHCVLYNADNLEELLDYYLSHDEERERIVEAAYLRVQDYSYERQVARWVERTNALDIPALPVATRKLGPEPADRYRARATHALVTLSPHRYQVAARELTAGLDVESNDPTLLNNLGVAYAASAAEKDDWGAQRDLLGRSLECLEAAKQASPAHVVALANLSEVRVRQGDAVGAELPLVDALAALPASDGELWAAWLALPEVMDAFYAEYERIAVESLDDPEGFTKAARRLYRWWLCERIGDLRNQQGDWQRASDAYQLAVTAWAVGSTRHSLARALLVLGRTNEAVEQLKAAITDEPFLLQARADLASALLLMGDDAGARQACAESLRLIRACPNYEAAGPAFDSMLLRCATLQA